MMGAHKGPVLVAVRPAAQRLATLPAALLPRAARPAAIVALATRRSRGL